MNVRIEFNTDGFHQLLNSSETRELVNTHVEEIRNRANANMGADGFKGEVLQTNYAGGRWIGFVGVTDRASVIAESEDKALTRAVHG